MLYCVRSCFGSQKIKFESSTVPCTIKKLSDNENINLKMPSFWWQGNLPKRASKIKRLLACHNINLPQASGQVLSYTSDSTAILLTNIFNDKLKLALCPGVCLLAPKHVSSGNFLNYNTHWIIHQTLILHELSVPVWVVSI